MKKNYIAPAVEIVQLNVADGILQVSGPEVISSDTSADPDADMETKESGIWSNIWE